MTRPSSEALIFMSCRKVLCSRRIPPPLLCVFAMRRRGLFGVCKSVCVNFFYHVMLCNVRRDRDRYIHKERERTQEACLPGVRVHGLGEALAQSLRLPLAELGQVAAPLEDEHQLGAPLLHLGQGGGRGGW